MKNNRKYWGGGLIFSATGTQEVEELCSVRPGLLCFLRILAPNQQPESLLPFTIEVLYDVKLAGNCKMDVGSEFQNKGTSSIKVACV